MSDIAQTSIYLNTEDRRIINELIERTGLPRSQLIRLAIRRMYSGDNSDRRERLIEMAEEIKRLA